MVNWPPGWTDWPRIGVTAPSGTTLRGNQGRLGLPPQTARTAGRPEGVAAPMYQSRDAHHPARPHHCPEGA